MSQIKIFRNMSSAKLENEVNKFLEENKNIIFDSIKTETLIHNGTYVLILTYSIIK